MVAERGTVPVDLVVAGLQAEGPDTARADSAEVSGAERASAAACPAEEELAVRAPRGRVAATWAVPV